MSIDELLLFSMSKQFGCVLVNLIHLIYPSNGENFGYLGGAVVYNSGVYGSLIDGNSLLCDKELLDQTAAFMPWRCKR